MQRNVPVVLTLDNNTKLIPRTEEYQMSGFQMIEFARYFIIFTAQPFVLFWGREDEIFWLVDIELNLHWFWKG